MLCAMCMRTPTGFLLREGTCDRMPNIESTGMFTVYGRRVGMFAGPGHFSYWIYMRMFLTGTICKLSIISSQQSGMEYL